MSKRYKSTAVGQAVACVPGFDPPSGQVSWVRFFRGFSSPVDKCWETLGLKVPEYHLAVIVVINHHSLRVPMT